MKYLLLASALIELAAGAVVLCIPSIAARLLFGSPLEAIGALAVARLTGAALLALGVACSLARCDANSCASRGVVSAMVAYNLLAVLILAATGIRTTAVGVALWPAVALHAAMTSWCVVRLMRRANEKGPE
jgi:hypothetical protein